MNFGYINHKNKKNSRTGFKKKHFSSGTNFLVVRTQLTGAKSTEHVIFFSHRTTNIRIDGLRMAKRWQWNSLADVTLCTMRPIPSQSTFNTTIRLRGTFPFRFRFQCILNKTCPIILKEKFLWVIKKVFFLNINIF